MHVRHALRLKGEPKLKSKLKSDMLVTMEGNDLLKRIFRRGAAPINGEDGDEPLVGPSVEHSDNRGVGGDHYLPREKVDRWSKEELAAEGQDDSGTYEGSFMI